MPAVFCQVTDEIVLQTDRSIGRERKEAISVIAAQPAPGSPDPDEAGTVHEHFIHEIAGQSILHRDEAGEIVPGEGIVNGSPGRNGRRKRQCIQAQYYARFSTQAHRLST